MADLSITTTQVQPTSDATKIKGGQCGEAITVGQVIYYKTSDGKYYKSQADGTAEEAKCVGIALSSTLAANQHLRWQTGGTITLGAGASLTAGVAYYVSGTAGGICPEADIASSSYATFLGISNGSNQLVMPANGPFQSGVQHA